MKTITVGTSGNYYLQISDTDIQINSSALATVTISAPVPYSINRQPTLTLLPAQSVILQLNGKNWEISGSTQQNTIPNLESGKFLTNNGVSLLWQTIVSGVSSVYGRTGAVTAQTGDYTVGQVTNAESVLNKDASGGYAGLTLFKINFKNALNTFTSFFTNSNTAARTYTFPDKDGTVAMTSDLTGGTVTSVAALTLGTTGTDLSSSVADGTTTPVITLNVPTASASNRGVLSAADWTTFNAKQAPITPAALTKTDDTNVTLTLGGTPTTALLQATSLTLGWTGVLSSARGGSDDWVDHSATSTIVGWSSFTTKQIRYKVFYKAILVDFYLNGTSDSTSVTFTLPTAMASVEFLSICRTVNNGTSNVGRFFIASGGSTVTVNSDVAGTGWTGSGTKAIQAFFIYETA